MVRDSDSCEVDSDNENSESSIQTGKEISLNSSIGSLSSSQNPTISVSDSIPRSLFLSQISSPRMETFDDYLHSLPISLPRKVPCVVLSPNNESNENSGERIPLFQVPVIDSPLDSIMAKISRLSSSVPSGGFKGCGNMIWKQSESYHEDNLKESMELYDSMKQIVKETDVSDRESLRSSDVKRLCSPGQDCSTSSEKLSFGIDRILSGKTCDNRLKDETKAHCSSLAKTHCDLSSEYLNHCTDCYLLSRYCYKYSPPRSPGSAICPSSSSSSLWSAVPHLYDSPGTFIPSGGFRNVQMPIYPHNNSSNYSGIPSIASCNSSSSGRRKRSWSRAVFSNLQRKGLEKRFQIQKYITKPDRRQLAATLGLTDAQVKVWFQNRRMKWRHTKEGKSAEANGNDFNDTTQSTTIIATSSIK